MGDTEYNNRVKWIDTAKGIGIICVILGHLYVPVAYAYIYSFHVPLFFFLSGYLFNNKYSFRDFLKRKVRGLIIPYFCLGIPLIFISSILESDGFSFDSLFKYFIKLIINQRLYTLWFLTCLFALEIFFYFFNKSIKNLYIQILISLVGCIIVLIYYEIGGKCWLWNIDLSIMALFFYIIGYAFKRKQIFENYIIKHKVVCIIITGAWVLGTFVNGHLFNTVLDMYNNKYGVFVISYIVAILGIIIVCCVSRYIKVDFIGYIGKNSLIYFAWHGSIGFRIMDFICGKFGLFDKTIDAMTVSYTHLTLPTIA